MGGRWDKVGRGIKAFVENPVTNLVKGMVLLLIGASEASRTLRDDLRHGQFRIGHGMIIIGIFSILEALPTLIGSLEAWGRYIDFREEEAKAKDKRGL